MSEIEVGAAAYPMAPASSTNSATQMGSCSGSAGISFSI